MPWETSLSDSLTRGPLSVRCMCWGGGGPRSVPGPVLAAEDIDVIKTELLTLIQCPWGHKTLGFQLKVLLPHQANK